jgi:hypothetical protein
VAAFGAGDAVEGVEAVVASEGHPALRLPAVAANEHALHRRLEVVVSHLVGRGPAQDVERVEVVLKEGFLAWLAKTRCTALPEQLRRKLNRKHLVSTPAR